MAVWRAVLVSAVKSARGAGKARGMPPPPLRHSSPPGTFNGKNLADCAVPKFRPCPPPGLGLQVVVHPSTSLVYRQCVKQTGLPAFSRHHPIQNPGTPYSLLTKHYLSSGRFDGSGEDDLISAIKKKLMSWKGKCNTFMEHCFEIRLKVIASLKKYWSMVVLKWKRILDNQKAILTKGFRDKSVDLYFSAVLLVVYCLFCRAVEKVEKKLYQLEFDSIGDPNDTNVAKATRRLAIMLINAVKYYLMVFSDAELQELRKEVNQLYADLVMLKGFSDELSDENELLKADMDELQSEVASLRKDVKKSSEQ